MSNVARQFTIETRKGIHARQGADTATHYARIVERSDIGGGWQDPQVRYETPAQATTESAVSMARDWAARNGVEVAS